MVADRFPYFDEFPEDVQRLVFEFAFEESSELASRSDACIRALELALVSKRVNQWIEPLMYRNISASQLHGSPIRDSSSKHNISLRKYVRSLTVDEADMNEFLEDILSECHTNLVGLAWWLIPPNRTKTSSFLLTRPFPSLRKLSIYYGNLPSDVESPFRKPIFQNLTHLDIGLPPTDAHFVPNSTNANLRKVASWKDLQSLESLIHLHLDMALALSFRAPSVTENLQEVILEITSYLPKSVQFFSLHLPYTFLHQASTLPAASRRVFDDLINGKMDARILVCYAPSKRWDAQSRMMTEAELISVEGFSEYLHPRNRSMQDDKRSRVIVPKPNNDFWEMGERMVRRRNRELYGNTASSSARGTSAQIY